MKALLIEDSPIVLGFLHEVLPRAGVEVVGETCVPQTAIINLRELKPEAMLIDLDLHDAMTVVKIANAEGPGLFIIGYAANITEGLVLEASKAGVNDLLAKPLGEPRLLEALEKCRGACTAEPAPSKDAQEPPAASADAPEESEAPETAKAADAPVAESVSESPADEADTGEKNEGNAAETEG